MEFADGQSAATISITVRDDDVSEIDETSLITLVEVEDAGTAEAGRGAQIGELFYSCCTGLFWGFFLLQSFFHISTENLL